jgi:hypothetical protein
MRQLDRETYAAIGDKIEPITFTPQSIHYLLSEECDLFRPFVNPFGLPMDQPDIMLFALSQIGEPDQIKDIYTDLKDFLKDPETKRYTDEEFFVPGKSFRTRPALKIVPFAAAPISGGISYEYVGKIYTDVKSSMHFVLENEHSPIASVGFNQFQDGVEIRYSQGVSSEKIGRESAADLNRLPNWREKLVTLVERYGEYKGLDYSMILPASEEMWAGTPEYPLERAQGHLDAIAARKQYTFHPRVRMYVKQLPHARS